MMEVIVRDHLPLGLVVHDASGHPWVYVGRHKNGNRCFTATQPLKTGMWEAGSIFWRKTRVALVKKFPDLADHWSEDTP